MFLSNDYEAPRMGGGYMKLNDGENRFRILSRPVLGWEDWKDKKPIRYPYSKEVPVAIDAAKPVKHFWAMIVWNYAESAIQILQITQASVRKAIEAFSKDEDWGAPFAYDIKVKREGQSKETKYTVTPLPHKPVSQAIRDAFNERRINLEALFTGDDPFSVGPFTEGFFEAPQEAPKSLLLMKLEECKPEFQSQVKEFLVKMKLPLSMEGLPDATVDKLEKSILRHLNEVRAATEAEMVALFGGT